MFPVRYELGVYITDHGTLHVCRRENLKCYKVKKLRVQFLLNVPLRKIA
jgi:hypothetical protein